MYHWQDPRLHSITPLRSQLFGTGNYFPKETLLQTAEVKSQAKPINAYLNHHLLRGNYIFLKSFLCARHCLPKKKLTHVFLKTTTDGVLLPTMSSWEACDKDQQEFQVGLPWWLSGKESACQCTRRGFDPWAGKIPWRRERLPTSLFLPGEFHGQRNLEGIHGVPKSQTLLSDNSNNRAPDDMSSLGFSHHQNLTYNCDAPLEGVTRGDQAPHVYPRLWVSADLPVALLSTVCTNAHHP